MGNAEPLACYLRLHLVREGVSHVFVAEVIVQNLAALTDLDKVYLSLLPEKNGFVRVWELVIIVGCCVNPVFCQKNV